MTPEQIEAKRASLAAERRRLDKRCLAHEARYKADHARRGVVDLELRRLLIVELIGQPAAVRVRYDIEPGSKCAKVNRQFGVVLVVKRKTALVDFGEAGKWNCRLDDLQTAEERKQFNARYGSDE